MNNAEKQYIRVVYGMANGEAKKAKAILEFLNTVNLDETFGSIDTAYKRVCVNCTMDYVVARTNAPKHGFCPVCDTDANRLELMRLNRQIRRAERAGVAATLTFRQWVKTLRDFRGLCAYCELHPYHDMEHFVPIRKGGGTTVDNCIPSCSYCNYRKKSRDPRKTKNMRLPRKNIVSVEKYLKSRIGNVQEFDESPD